MGADSGDAADADGDVSSSEEFSVEVPPSPRLSASSTGNSTKDHAQFQQLEDRVRHFFALKSPNANGGVPPQHINDHIQRSRDYSNPYAIKEVLGVFGIDEYATNFEQGMYDPGQYVSVGKKLK